MAGFPDVVQLTKILSDESRVQIMTSLMDGRYHTVHELAQIARVQDHTVSYHLNEIKKLGWLHSFKQGRYHYFCLANADVAELIEKAMYLSPQKPIRSFRESEEHRQLAEGRSCYCHLAGKLGVRLLADLERKGYLKLAGEQVYLTEAGERFFSDVGLDLEELRRRKGCFVKVCLDWTERRFHLAGHLGTAFFKHAVEERWLKQHSVNRSVQLTAKGERAFRNMFE
ncbi:ArsR/SmtB family transcription factor [Listeria costaricensis]|uniref:ArsR/SmtB family transcription factor n=1 Tax=Listeria costaricensis TaxID=2026604 RepID=UPI0013C4218C|nr:ArsR family transcriptional regulator [Listeria costaricensis]